jgi:hypothetical protein
MSPIEALTTANRLLARFCLHVTWRLFHQVAGCVVDTEGETAARTLDSGRERGPDRRRRDLPARDLARESLGHDVAASKWMLWSIIDLMDQREHRLLAVAAETQARINEAIDGMTTSEIAGTGFDQLGLRDGLEIVEKYLHAGEFGVAFHHLRYMVVETEVALSPAAVRFLEDTAAALGLPARRLLHTR